MQNSIAPPEERVSVRVKPGNKKGPLVQPSLTGELLVYVREPAIDGKANQAVTKLLAQYFEVPKNNVRLVSGRTSRHKRFKIIRPNQAPDL